MVHRRGQRSGSPDDGATKLEDLRACPVTVWKPCTATDKASSASASICNGEFALNGPPVRLAHPPSRSWTITHQETAMHLPTHPGNALTDALAELNITPTELARQIAVPANRLS